MSMHWKSFQLFPSLPLVIHFHLARSLSDGDKLLWLETLIFFFPLSRFKPSLLLELECFWGLPPILLRFYCGVCCDHSAAARLRHVCRGSGLPGCDVWGDAGRPTAAAELPKPFHQRNEVQRNLIHCLGQISQATRKIISHVKNFY